MKKLIAELEKEYESDKVQWCDLEYQQCFNHALQIVKTHNPWISVEVLPPVGNYENENCSIQILILLSNGNIHDGYYLFDEKCFWIVDRRSIAKVTHWTHLPGAQP